MPWLTLSLCSLLVSPLVHLCQIYTQTVQSTISWNNFESRRAYFLCNPLHCIENVAMTNWLDSYRSCITLKATKDRTLVAIFFGLIRLLNVSINK
jgi:hypothetical protein